MRKVLKDRNAQLQCDTQIRESQRYIDYFTEELRRLKTKGHRASFILSHQNSESSTITRKSSSNPTTPGSNEGSSGVLPQQTLTESPSQQASESSYFPSTSSISSVDSKRIKYTNLGTLKYTWNIPVT